MKKSPPPRIERRPVDGVLLLDKPVGISSNTALQHARRLYRAEKAGHTGTLDPLASGLLPLCFGEATKFAQYLLDARKRYTATIRFGATTTTGDSEGEVRQVRPVTFGPEALAAALARFTGPLMQVPPAYSALKFEGRPHYEYARAGQEVPRAPRAVEIHALRLVSWTSPDAVVDVECSKGTYVRVLAEDLGEALGCGAHLAGLRRTATGGFALDDAVTFAQLEAVDEAARDARLLPAAVLVGALPRAEVAPADAARFRQGQPAPSPGAADGPCALFAGADFLGVAEVAGALAHPRRVVVPRP
ncbi:MAG TPA: tRNA pseudouridine(55) synthase TruB [Casimicrobiaceae bacterium]